VILKIKNIVAFGMLELNFLKQKTWRRPL